jgi:hypothetical protein
MTRVVEVAGWVAGAMAACVLLVIEVEDWKARRRWKR